MLLGPVGRWCFPLAWGCPLLGWPLLRSLVNTPKRYIWGLGAGAGAGGWVLLGPMGLLVPIYADQPGRLGKEALATLQGTTSPRFQ